MEDFANILQRNYGLKPQGKSAPMAGGAGHSRAGSDVGRGGSGSGRSGRTGADDDDLFFGGGNGNSKGSTNRYSETSDVFGGPADDIFGAAPAKGSVSGVVYDDVFGGPPPGASSSNSFGDLLGGFSTTGSKQQPNQSSFNDDLLGGFGKSKSRAADSPLSSSVDDIFSTGPDLTERASARSNLNNHNVEYSFLGALGISKPEPQVSQSQTMFDHDWGFGGSKAGPRTGTLHASIDGDLLGGVATSSSRAKSSTPFRSPPSSPPRTHLPEPIFDEFLPGFGGDHKTKSQPAGDADAFRGIPIISTTADDDVFKNISSATSPAEGGLFRDIPSTNSNGDADAFQGIPPVKSLDADEMRGIPPLSSPVLVDDDPFSTTSAVDPFANITTDAGIPQPSPAAVFPDPTDPFSMPAASAPSGKIATEENTVKSSANDTNGGSGSFDLFDGFSQPPPVATSKVQMESGPSRSGSSLDGKEGSQHSRNLAEKSSMHSFGGIPFNVDLNETPEVESPTYPSQSYKLSEELDSNGSAPKYDNEPKFDEPTIPVEEYGNGGTVIGNPFEDKWLTIDDVKLVTQPSSVPPPSRAPPRPGLDKRSSGSKGSANYRENVVDSPSLRDRLPRERSRRQDEQPVYRSNPKLEPSKEADLARERAADRERQAAMVQKEREAAQRERERQRERQMERERQRDRLREQEMPREAESMNERSAPKQEEVRERETDQAAERAKRAAEKVALEAQQRVEKAAAERAFIEARERAEKAALQRAAAAAREKERAEREEYERREREAREKREREERARRDKARAERERERERREKEEREKERERDRERDRRRERERGAAEQPRPSSASSSRATSEPRQRPPTNQPSPSANEARRPSPGNPVYSSTGSSPAPVPAARKPQTPVKAVDDWTTLLTQTAPTGDEFQEIPGEAPERRKLRLERHQRMAERAAQALKEKNDRDKAQLMEQAERSRSAGNLDAEIRRWATGKEGNLRALLSSLHLMLWPECNWKPLSLTDLITGISVKKAYQKAILCVHPDKVQQKGANVQQKYIAEKVFDILKEAFAKFNANELY